MAGTFTHLVYHCIWSTKHRAPLLTKDIEQTVWGTLNTVAKKHKMHLLKAGGIEDHIHVLVDIPKTISVSDGMKRLKGGSSKFINDEKLIHGGGRFAWQEGYGSFTVSRSGEEEVVKYIENQGEHHRTMTFQEEFRRLLHVHGLEYDEKYLWG